MTASAHRENGRAAAREARAETPPTESVEALLQAARNMRAHAVEYVAARKDRLIASAQHVALNLALLALAGVVAVCVLAVASVLALNGLANLLSAWLGDRVWAGQLIVGFGTLIGFGLGLKLLSSYMTSRWLSEAKARYEHRHALQRTSGNRSVAERN